MKRFCVAPIIGTGTRSDPYRASVPRGMKYSAHIPTDELGKPIGKDALVWVEVSDNEDEAEEQLKRLAHAEVEVLPSAELNTPVSTVVQAMGEGKFRSFQALEDTPQETYRDYLVALARRNEYEFDEERLNEMLGVRDDE